MRICRDCRHYIAKAEGTYGHGQASGMCGLRDWTDPVLKEKHARNWMHEHEGRWLGDVGRSGTCDKWEGR